MVFAGIGGKIRRLPGFTSAYHPNHQLPPKYHRFQQFSVITTLEQLLRQISIVVVMSPRYGKADNLYHECCDDNWLEQEVMGPSMEWPVAADPPLGSRSVANNVVHIINCGKY